MFVKYIFVSALLFSTLLAQGRFLSSISAPSTEIVNLHSGVCDQECLRQLVYDGQAFSFIARFHADVREPELLFHYKRYINKLRIHHTLTAPDRKPFRIALLLPQKVIGKYAISTSKALMAYLLTRQNDFELEVFDSGEEDQEAIATTLEKIKQSGFQNLIAIVTERGARHVIQHAGEMQVYLPAINKSDLKMGEYPPHTLFGGINYEEQIKTLFSYSQTPVAVYYDQSPLGLNLREYAFKNSSQGILFDEAVEETGRRAFQRQISKKKKQLQESTILLNTPIVKTSLIMSQLTYHEIEPSLLLSTQINYNPILLSLTQEADREKLCLANSIGDSHPLLEENNHLLESDIRFDWINYSVSLGVDYFYTENSPYDTRFFHETIEDGQVQYDIKVLQAEANRFSQKPETEPTELPAMIPES